MVGEDEAELRQRSQGAAKAGHLWDAFYDAPQARSDDKSLALEDARDCIVKPADSEVDTTTADGDGQDSTTDPHASALQRQSEGDAWRNVPGPDGKLPDERISHLICRVLRYHLDQHNLTADEEGYIGVTDLLSALPELQSTTEEDIRRIVRESVSARGARYELRDGDIDGALQIRATYRHPKEGQRQRRGHRDRSLAMIADGRRGELPSWNAPVGSFASGRPRPGFSRLPIEQGDQNESSDDERWAPASASRPAQSRSDEISLRGDALSKPAAASSAAQGAAEEPQEERWELYYEPSTNRVWFWREATEETFFADDPTSGWERFEDSEGRPWWWHEVSGRFFFEEQ